MLKILLVHLNMYQDLRIGENMIEETRNKYYESMDEMLDFK